MTNPYNNNTPDPYGRDNNTPDPYGRDNNTPDPYANKPNFYASPGNPKGNNTPPDPYGRDNSTPDPYANKPNIYVPLPTGYSDNSQDLYGNSAGTSGTASDPYGSTNSAQTSYGDVSTYGTPGDTYSSSKSSAGAYSNPNTYGSTNNTAGNYNIPNVSYPAGPVPPYLSPRPQKSVGKRISSVLGTLVFIIVIITFKAGLYGGVRAIFNQVGNSGPNTASAANFSDGCNQWPGTNSTDKLTINCGGGVYSITYNDQGYIYFMPYNNYSSKNVSIEATFKADQFSGTDEYGLYVQQTTTSALIAKLTPSGSIFVDRFYRKTGGKLDVLGSKSGVIIPNGIVGYLHTLRLSVKDNQLDFYVDNTLVNHSTLTATSTGEVGLLVSSDNPEPVKVEVSNIKITEQ